MIARVVTELSLDRGFDYLVPAELEEKIRIGSAVTVPFGRTLREGVVLALPESSPSPLSKLKPIAGLCTSRADVPEKLIALGQWIAEYYCCSQEHAIRTLLPAAVRSGKIRPKTRKLYTIAKSAEAEKLIVESAEKSSLRSKALILRELRSAGTMSIDSLKNIPNFSMSSLNTLLKNEIIAAEEEIVRADIFGDAVIMPSKPLPPTPDQQKALVLFDEMRQGKTASKVMLLHGVTNSGKTEVYLQCIAKVLEEGKSAIVLVPEISLTPQTLRRFRSRFGDALSVLHSRLSERERYDEWNRINEGKVRIAIGARSALFAPFRNLGLIVVDEEHESTYKQSESPRYMARDVAVMRGKFEDACVILGSATPSAESMFNAKNGKFLLAKMNSQANDNAAPVMRLVDLRLENPEDGNPLFSKPLIEAVRDRIARGEQSILFLNLRGYARVMVCKECSYEAWCPECSVHYTYSKSRQTLSCHLCGNVIPAPESCPEWSSPTVRFDGAGTEKIESIARAVFKGARIARMDSDLMRSANDYEAVLEKFRRGELDILIGTQMIAKGLHFPNVTLVGILMADLGLSSPDFRASERTFQLITQVAGRAGRGELRGEVYLQTRKPDNETIIHSMNLDFAAFSAYDLEFRELFRYPPFSRLIAVWFRGSDEEQLADYASNFTEQLRPYAHEKIKLAGPGPAPIARIKGKFRYLLTIRGEGLKVMRQALKVLAFHRKHPGDIEVAIDVDPQSLI